MKKILHVAFALMALFHFNVAAQAVTDSTVVTPATEKEKKGSIFSGRPGKSMLMSLVIPGAGQIYNKSYLRVPFVWGAVGGMGYLLYQKTQEYNCLREKYVTLIDGTTYEIPQKCPPRAKTIINSTDNPVSIRYYRDKANVNRQWAIIGFSLVWLANGVDAFVDAHLKDFDIDEDLSIDIGPIMDDDPYAPMRVGICLQF